MSNFFKIKRIRALKHKSAQFIAFLFLFFKQRLGQVLSVYFNQI